MKINIVDLRLFPFTLRQAQGERKNSSSLINSASPQQAGRKPINAFFSLALLSALFVFPLFAGAAALELRQFDDPGKQQRYEELIKELRCLVCQNQALSDSDADLAKDLRDEVYRIIQSGKTDQEAIDFLVSRYGDFVLYRPPFKPLTLLLWGGPLLLALIGGVVLWRNQRNGNTQTLSADDIARLKQLRAQADQTKDLS